MKNVSRFTNCYGCGVCAVICASNAIEIVLNKDGFYGPSLDERKCVHCGKCIRTCAFVDKRALLNDFKMKSYAAWSNDTQTRLRCSSGGIGFEIGKQLIDKGYKICGVKYNIETERAEHYISTTIDELNQSIGSKYIQSYTVDGFKKINIRDKYLVIGTPCQMDSLRRYISQRKVENNFVLMDFFCHGTPSMLLWRKYMQRMKNKIGKIASVSWRNKKNGWHDSWVMRIDGELQGKKVSYGSCLSQGDLFYKMFLSNACLAKACYFECKYKNRQSAADIRVGDLWGSKYRINEEGVSSLIALTLKGQEIVNGITNCTLLEEPFGIATEGQMKASPQYPANYKINIFLLKTRIPLIVILRVHALIRFVNKKISNLI